MTPPERAPRPVRYLAEWYRGDLTDEHLDRLAAALDRSTTGSASPVRVLMLLAVPADEVIFAVFAAESACAVTGACERAGSPVHRLTPAVEAHPLGS